MCKLILLMRKGAWNEGQHPRDGGGRFASTPDNGGKALKDDRKFLKETSLDFNFLSGILESGKSETVKNSVLGDITIDKGETGKKGYGLSHIIEQRLAEGKNTDEITAILHLVVMAAAEGIITREIPFKNNPNHKGRIELEKNGVIALLSRQRNQGDDEKWLLTGFSNSEKKEEATDAIQTVIAQYSFTPEFSGFRKQVGAVISSLITVSPRSLKKSRKKLVISKRAGTHFRARIGGRK